MTTPQSILDRFPKLDDAFVEARLGRPSAKPRVIIDTDTANEIELALRQNAGLIAEKFLEEGSRDDFEDDGDSEAGAM